jgi:hypothetical protein
MPKVGLAAFSPDQLDHLSALVVDDVGNRYRCALTGEQQADGMPDTACSAGHNDNFFLNASHLFSPLFRRLN